MWGVSRKITGLILNKWCNLFTLSDIFGKIIWCDMNENNEVTEKENSDRTSHHPHSDLYTRNLTLINITKFKFIINNDICNVAPIAIVTIVPSSPVNKEARDIIRYS